MQFEKAYELIYLINDGIVHSSMSRRAKTSVSWSLTIIFWSIYKKWLLAGEIFIFVKLGVFLHHPLLSFSTLDGINKLSILELENADLPKVVTAESEANSTDLMQQSLLNE